MPTAAKLVATVLFAVVGLLAANAYGATLPDGQPAFWLAPVCVVLGIWHGWFTMGRHVGNGMLAAAGTGIRTSVQIAFFAVLGFATFEMFHRSVRLRYDGPGEALIAALELVLEYGLSMVVVVPCLATLIGGGVVAGLVTEAVNSRWS